MLSQLFQLIRVGEVRFVQLQLWFDKFFGFVRENVGNFRCTCYLAVRVRNALGNVKIDVFEESFVFDVNYCLSRIFIGFRVHEFYCFESELAIIIAKYRYSVKR